MITENDKRAFSISEFCCRFGVGRTTAYGEIKAGRLQVVKAGKRTLGSSGFSRILAKKSPDRTGGVMSAAATAAALGGRMVGGGWTARCPAHDDRTHSLSIRSADDGSPYGVRELSPEVLVMKRWSPRDGGPA